MIHCTKSCVCVLISTTIKFQLTIFSLSLYVCASSEANWKFSLKCKQDRCRVKLITFWASEKCLLTLYNQKEKDFLTRIRFYSLLHWETYECGVKTKKKKRKNGNSLWLSFNDTLTNLGHESWQTHRPNGKSNQKDSINFSWYSSLSFLFSLPSLFLLCTHNTLLPLATYIVSSSSASVDQREIHKDFTNCVEVKTIVTTQ